MEKKRFFVKSEAIKFVSKKMEKTKWKIFYKKCRCSREILSLALFGIVAVFPETMRAQNKGNNLSVKKISSKKVIELLKL